MLKLTWIQVLGRHVSFESTLTATIYAITSRSITEYGLCMCGDITVRQIETRIIYFLQYRYLNIQHESIKKTFYCLNNFSILQVHRCFKRQPTKIRKLWEKLWLTGNIHDIQLRARSRVATRSQDRYIVINDLRISWRSAYTTARQKNVLFHIVNTL